MRFGLGLPIGVRIVRRVLIPKEILPEPVTLGEHLKQHRNKEKLLQREVAHILGVTKECYFLWEHDRNMPLPVHFPKILEWLGYDPLPEPRTDGEKAKRCRLQSGLSIKEAAIQIGVDEATLASYEVDGVLKAESIQKILGWTLSSHETV
jgi:DNA-binding XRE family transcriptional regulator